MEVLEVNIRTSEGGGAPFCSSVRRPTYRGFVLAAAAQGSSPGLGPFAACHYPLSQPLSCHVSSCSINKKQPKLKERERERERERDREREREEHQRGFLRKKRRW